MEKIIDINRNKIPSSTVFHFKDNSRPFILVHVNGDDVFIDLSIGEGFLWGELDFYDLEFYTKEDDDDFQGVAIIGGVTIIGEIT